MNEETIHLLIVEDDEDDFILTRDLLAGNRRTKFVVEWASTYESGYDAFARQAHHVCLVDYRLGARNGIELVQAAREQGWQTPLILLTGQDHHDVDLEAMSAGAMDYLVKGRFDGLVLERTIRYALERRRAQREIHEKEERFRTFMDNSPAVAFIKDASGRYVYLSSQVEPILCRKPAEAVGCTDFDFLPELEARRIRKNDHEVLATGRNSETVEIATTPDGKRRHWLVSRFLMREAENVRLLGGVGLDITARIQAERQIRDQAELLDKAHEAIIVRDMAGRITYWSRGAEMVYGWTAAEAAVREPVSLPALDESLEFLAANQQVLEKGEWQGELHQQTKDGREIVVFSSRTLVRDDEGKPKAIFAINADVTEKKDLAARMLRSQRMDSIGSLAGGIAHDLNNALSPILMATEMLQMECTKPETRKMLDIVYRSAERGAGMVKQILTFARGADGERGVVPVKHLVREISDMVRQTFFKAIEIRTEVSNNCGTIQGNPTQLHQVLLNLLVNARDAMPYGGVMTLGAELVRLDEFCTQISPDARPGSYVLLRVSDTGTGMSPEVRKRIFDPFFTTKPPDKGTGLGLSTVWNIVKDHGGFMTVESELGKGSTFKVYLPAADAAAKSGAEALRSPPPMGKGELILVVDDEAAIRNIAAQTLQNYGYRVAVASDGAQAVALFAQQLIEFQLVITDRDMPIMDGAATIRAVRALVPTMKIIITSGSEHQPLESPEGLDVQAVVHKPYSADELLRSVHKVIADPSRAPEAAGK